MKKLNFKLPGRVLLGSSIMGWGIFNLVEGLINHFFVDIHHVIQNMGRSVYDYAFLASGIILIITGFLIQRNLKGERGTVNQSSVSYQHVKNKKNLLLPGILLGIGLGGILEGILFFQVFQLHGMVTAIYPPDTVLNIRTGMIYDGLYHLFTWTIIVVAVYLLWKGSTSNYYDYKSIIGAALLGLRGLNIVEGIIDHHIFSIHHVVEVLGQSIYDYIFLIASGVIFLAGIILYKRNAVSNQLL